jgi:hypothetical protein
MTARIRQLREEEVRPPLLPAGEATSILRSKLEARGVAFRPDSDPGAPGPNVWAAVELEDGTQFAFEHFYNEDFVSVRAQPDAMSPAQRLDELRTALDFAEDAILTVFEHW